MSQDAARAPRLLFVSDAGNNDVDIFTLPSLKLKGTITGFNEPQGECSDTAGNVWIANTGTLQMLEYSHSGKLIGTLNDPVGYPASCAVDPTTGNLAVFNIFDISGPGEILLYVGASGTPTPISIEGFYYYGFGGFDPRGNLFATGRNSSGAMVLGEVPSGAGAGHLTKIIGGSVYYFGFAQWYQPGNYLAVDDQLCGDAPSACIYRIKISGSRGKIIGKTTLLNYSGGQVCDLVQAVIENHGGRYVAGGDYEYCGSVATSVDRWPYPAGGKPTNFNTSAGLLIPIGAAISAK